MRPTATSVEVELRPENIAQRWLFSYGPGAVVAVAFVFYATRLFRLVSQYAVNIFFWDQWDFNNATLFEKHSLWEIFTWQHGPHRQGLGGLFAKLVEPYFGWNSRTESFVVGGVIVVAAICALWLKKRLYGRLSFWDVPIPALIFVPAQYETLFITANFAHGPFPLLLILLYCLAWTCQNRAARYSLILIVNFVTIYTGFGLLLGVLTPVLLIIDFRSSPPEERLPVAYLIGTILVSLLSFGSFFVGYKFEPASDCFSTQPLSLKYDVAYMALMFSHFLAMEGIGVSQLVLGLTVLIALFAALVTLVWQLGRGHDANLTPAQRKRPLIATALVAYCIVFCASTAYGRLCGGLGTARASRYVIYLELGVLGAYLGALNLRRASARRSALAGLLLAALAASSYINRAEMNYFFQIKLQWRRCYFMNEDINLCDQSSAMPIYPNAPMEKHLKEKLDYLRVTRQNLYADAK